MSAQKNMHPHMIDYISSGGAFLKPLLELTDVCYSYHSKNGETYALSDISFQVQKSEFVVIVGPSGCGKSTLLSLISGLLEPESGSILFEPETGKSEARKREEAASGQIGDMSNAAKRAQKNTDFRTKTGYMLQKDHLFEWRTIYGNVTLGLEIQGKLNEESQMRIDKMLMDYGLYRFRNARPSELSGGMRQRAALIRTLALEPELLLLDEPFSALDFQTRLSVCDDVAKILRKEKKTAILVTHDLSEAVSMADRIIVLSKRPARIKKIIPLKFADEKLSPFERRNAPEFKEYFNLLWKELNGTNSSKIEAEGS